MEGFHLLSCIFALLSKEAERKRSKVRNGGEGRDCGHGGKGDTGFLPLK